MHITYEFMQYLFNNAPKILHATRNKLIKNHTDVGREANTNHGVTLKVPSMTKYHTCQDAIC